MQKSKSLLSLRLTVAMFAILKLSIFTQIAEANVAEDLDETFRSLNMDTNITSAGSFKDQTGGYYTGGSIFARVPAKNTNIANVQLPSYNAGCGGIDIFTGALSFLNAGELVNNMKAAIPAAGGYAFAMAMQTYTPQLYNVMTELQDWAQKINSLNINSCETAQLAVGGMWPRSDAASKHLCSTLGSSSGMVTDWVKARHECGLEDSRKDINKQKDKGDGFKDQLGEEFNLVWKAIQKNDFLAKDEKLAEFFMSVSGTIVKIKDRQVPKNYPSLAIKRELIQMLVLGQASRKNQKGSAASEIYTCDDKQEDKCLYPKKISFVMKQEDSLSYKIEQILTELSKKVIADEEPLPQEIGLVESTDIPIMKIIAIEAAYKRGAAPISVLEYTDAISYDILLKYLQTILDLVASSLSELEKVQIEADTITQFKTEIRDVRSQIVEERNSMFQKIITALDIVKKTQVYERELQTTFNEYSNLKDRDGS